MCVCFFLGWEPQKLDDSLNRKSESKHFRKNSVICIVCLLKLCIQSWLAQTKGPKKFEFNLWVWFSVPCLASTTAVISISFTDHGVVCNEGTKLWYVVSRCWAELKAETITLLAGLRSELWSIFGASNCSVFSIRWLSWNRVPSSTRLKQSYRLELEVGLSNSRHQHYLTHETNSARTQLTSVLGPSGSTPRLHPAPKTSPHLSVCRFAMLYGGLARLNNRRTQGTCCVDGRLKNHLRCSEGAEAPEKTFVIKGNEWLREGYTRGSLPPERGEQWSLKRWRWTLEPSGGMYVCVKNMNTWEGPNCTLSLLVITVCPAVCEL